MQQKRRLLAWLTPALLILILLIAAGLRLYNINWDGGIFAHPDERSTVAFYAPTIKWPDDPATLLDPKKSTLNPFWNVTVQERRAFTYGHFPLYTLVLVANTLQDLVPWAVSLELPAAWLDFLTTSLSGHGFARIGRILVALSDVATVYLIYLIGRHLYGRWGGLLAAALSAFTVLQIQLAHFFAVDPISTTFTLLALYGAMLLYERRSVGAAVITGVGIALAVASKFSALPIISAPIAAGLLAVWHHKKGITRQTGSTAAPASGSLAARMVGLVALTLLIAFGLFAVTSPFVLLDFSNFQRAVLEEQGNMVSGVADFPFTRQYRNTPAYWFFIEEQLKWGMGWPLGLLGLAGTVWVTIKALRGKAQVGELLGLLWIVLYFGLTGLFLAKFMRYMVPVVPLFTLFGAGLIVSLWRYRPKPKKTAGNRSGAWANSEQADVEPENKQPDIVTTSPSPRRIGLPQAAAISLAVIVLVGSAVWALAFVNGVYGSDHTWVSFARWVYKNVPDGSCIAYEHWDDRMPSDIPEPGGHAGAHQYYQPQLPMYDDDTQQKYELLRDTLIDCDYVVLASNRLWRTIPRLPERYPMSIRYYQALFSGDLGYDMVHTEETPPRLGPLVIDTQPADESFTVYDHPKPILFQKKRQLSQAEWDALLGNSWTDAIPGYIGPTTLLMRLRGAQDRIGRLQTPQIDPAEEKSLLLDSPVDQLTVINDFRWNAAANSSTLVAVVSWWLIALAAGIIALPFTFAVFGKLPDYGYPLSKSFGLLLVSYFVWLNSSLGLLKNTVATVLIAFVILFVIGLLIFIKQHRKFLQIWREQSWLMLGTELLFGLIYLVFVYIRILNPDLWHPWLGGEKMLEIGFLNAIVKSADMPPYDPFFAGGIINYYYYGLFLIGVLIKLSGIQPAIAFNLAIPTLAALTAINAFSLGGNLAANFGKKAPDQKKATGRQIRAINYVTSGLLAILFIVFMGNLEGTAQFMRNLADLNVGSFESAIPGLSTLILAIGGFTKVIAGDAMAIYNYWDPTRVIPETINEFPFFSFLFADLHPHMIGIPFTILFMSLAYSWILPETSALLPAVENGATARWSSSMPGARDWWRWLAIPFILGAIAVINTWDLPTYLGLMVATFVLSRYRQLKGDLDLKQIGLLAISAIIFAAGLLVLTYLLYAPFFINYQPPAETGVGLVHTRTPLDQHLKIWGFFIFVITSWLWIQLLHPGSKNSLLRTVSLALRRWNVWPHLSEIFRAVVKQGADIYTLLLWSIGILFVISAGLFLLGYRVPAYLLPLVVLAFLLLTRREASAATSFLCLLSFTGLSILLGVEFFFLRDFLGGGDYYRMNTLFKFFIQVWVIFGLVTAVALPQVWNWAWRWPFAGQLIWRTLAVLLLLAGFIYPVLGTRTRIDDRFPGDHNRPSIGTLDGLAYMTVGSFEWPSGNPIELKYDYEAIQWLQNNVVGTPVLAEAKIGYYREGGMRVAAYTGLPSVLGGLHQNEQRYGSQVAGRDVVVNEFWTSPNLDRTTELMDILNISYIYIGQIERATYGDIVEDKFEQLHEQGYLELVFENEQTKIYKRKL